MSSRRSPLLALPRLPRGRSWSLAALVGLLVAFEAVGRFAPNDWADGLVLALLALGTTMALRPRGSDLWALAEARLREAAQRYGFDVGIDLRREPELERGTPKLVGRAIWCGLALLAVQSVLLLTLRPNLRPLLQSFFYSAWLALLAVLWAGIVLGIGLSLLLLSQLLRDELLRARRRGHVGNLGGALVLATAVVVLLASARWFLPTWIPGAALVLTTAVMLARTRFGAVPQLDLLWRERRGGAVRSVPWGKVLALRNGMLALAALAIDLSARGGAAIGLGAELEAVEDTPLTYLLGTIFAWLAAAAIALQTRSDLRDLKPELDPSMPRPLTLHASGGAFERERERLAVLCRRLGWALRVAPALPLAGDVAVQLVDKMPPLRTRRWPLAVSATALEMEELQEIVRRRDVVQRRRALLRGLKRLWKALGRSAPTIGQGVLLAPQYWFFVGMTRDGQDSIALSGEPGAQDQIVGPPYREVFTPEARAHAWDVGRALQIDLLFVEDGVGFSALRRVLQTMFEHHDVHAGKLRAEEWHFVGLPQVRVTIHDHELGELAPRRPGEPAMEELGRARVLHVFRRRGGRDEDLIFEAPRRRRDAPSPTPVLV
ncbi:MAG: hypothetical protein IPN34_08410 [Planctomycetes bacterium]|nr:hypothetical protein [Planctomycetota bacterium]